ncbi:hypothetical protein CI109_105126 [Kwoniella shandongensis]|uniref:sulfiredoxin n=1 Tax=Kwoniella shandongensis TaxID=1734106 RepID=A0A5M6C470_9TREE|nr:uncharacterized protein CI109_001965 [Kwoniella shandongensis]KAA5529540.1 hypothetical protein CI109_001965 [Kwoniella shandongensis]
MSSSQSDIESGPSCLPTELQPQPSTSKTPDGTSTATATAKPTSSVFSRGEDVPVHNVPMRVIHRPLPSELDEEKVKTFMEEMKSGDTFTPIEIIKVKSPLKTNPSGPPETFYFAMGGCHRYEATKRLGLESIRARIIEVPAKQMRVYLGAGSPF